MAPLTTRSPETLLSFRAVLRRRPGSFAGRRDHEALPPPRPRAARSTMLRPIHVLAQGGKAAPELARFVRFFITDAHCGWGNRGHIGLGSAKMMTDSMQTLAAGLAGRRDAAP